LRKLYLIRHAKSNWDSPGLRDFERPLDQRGLHDAPLMADFLVKRGVLPDLIVSSPAKRAMTTAQFFVSAFDLSSTQLTFNKNIYEAFTTTLLKIISGLPDDANVVLMFGHNPTFTDVANTFTDDFIGNVPTCGIVEISSETAKSWTEFSELNARVTGCFFPKEQLL
jgi:phosphohistidine phosphatase